MPDSRRFVTCPHCLGWRTCTCVLCAPPKPRAGVRAGDAGESKPAGRCATCHGAGLVAVQTSK